MNVHRNVFRYPVDIGYTQIGAGYRNTSVCSRR